MVVAGKIRRQMSLRARIHFGGGSVNAPWFKVCNIKEMVTVIVKLLGQDDVRSIMGVAGKVLRMDRCSLHVWNHSVADASVLLDLGEMVSRSVKIKMNAKKNWPVNAQNVAAKTHGVAMIVAVKVICCTLKTMILV